jgi:hypothetical protein
MKMAAKCGLAMFRRCSFGFMGLEKSLLAVFDAAHHTADIPRFSGKFLDIPRQRCIFL